MTTPNSNLPEVFRKALAPFTPPSEEEFNEADRLEDKDKGERRNSINEAQAADLQMQHLDAMRREGAI